MSVDMQGLQAYQWSRQPEAEAFLRGVVEEFLGRVAAAGELERRMEAETGTRFFDWIDSVELPQDAETHRRLIDTGFKAEEGEAVFRHPEGMFPRVKLSPR